jgi:hypothetical protein
MAEENRPVGPAIGAVIFLLLAVIGRWPYAFYTLLRVVVCATAIYVAIWAGALKKPTWIWLMAIVAFLFNPIVPVRLPRADWQLIDVLVAGIFVAALLFLRRRK